MLGKAKDEVIALIKKYPNIFLKLYHEDKDGIFLHTHVDMVNNIGKVFPSFNTDDPSTYIDSRKHIIHEQSWIEVLKEMEYVINCVKIYNCVKKLAVH
jgi:hypothetical protein